jgi:NADPH2:quinone reductase
MRCDGHVHVVAPIKEHPQIAGRTFLLAQKGSLYVTRPTLGTYAAKRTDLLAMAQDLFDVVLSGKVKIKVNQTYPLREAAKAHQDLQARKTTGSTVLTV